MIFACFRTAPDVRPVSSLTRYNAGVSPTTRKPMSSLGHGVLEIRVRDESGAFRVLYVAKFERAIYVLHCFQKKTQKTGKTDLDLTRRRYRDLLKDLKK